MSEKLLTINTVFLRLVLQWNIDLDVFNIYFFIDLLTLKRYIIK